MAKVPHLPSNSRTQRLRLPLRLYALASFVLLVVGVGVVLGLVASRGSQRLIDEAVSTSLANHATLALQDLKRLEETARAGAEALAASPIVRTTSQDERDEWLHVLATVLNSAPGVSAAYLGWPNGDFMLLRPAVRPTGFISGPAGAVWLAQWAGPNRSRFDFLDADFAVIERRDVTGYAFDPRTRPWFLDALATPDTVVTTPYIFFTTREPGISAARRGAGGVVAGVDVSLWDLSTRLPSGQPVPSAEAAILDSSGGVLAYSRASRLHQIVTTNTLGVPLSEVEALPPVSRLGVPALEVLAAQLRTSNAPFMGMVEVQSEEWLAVIAPLDHGGAAFVMAAPIQEIGSGPQMVRTWILQLFTLIVAFAIPLVWYAARRLAHPVEVFTEDLKRVAKLDFSPPPRTQTRVKELLELDEAIHTMRSSLGSFNAVCQSIIEEQDSLAMLEATLDTLMTAGEADLGAAWLGEDTRGAMRPLVQRERGLGAGHAAFQSNFEAIAAHTFGLKQATVFETKSDEVNQIRALLVLGIPLYGKAGQVVGAMAIARLREEGAFTPTTLSLAVFIARAVALSVDRPRLIAEREAARRETEMVLTSVAMGIHVLDPQSRIRRQNPAAETMLGWTEAELLGQPTHALFHHHHRDGRPYAKEDCPVQKTLKDGQVRHVEGEVFFRKDGSSFPVEYGCAPLRDKAETIIGAVVSFHDVSARLKAHEQAEEWRSRLERLIDQARVGILVHRNFKPILANRELARMFDYDSLEEILSLESCRDLFAEEEQKRIDTYNTARLRGEDVPTLYQIKGRRRDGKPLVMENRAFTIQWGDHMAVCAMLTDITAQLETEKQLRQSQRLEAAGQLTGGIAHDFNNLLTVILGNAELLSEKLAHDPRLLMLAEVTVKAAERGAELTNHLLAFARHQPLEPRPSDVNKQIADMEKLLRRTLGEHIEITMVQGKDLWPAMIDPGQLENAILNLCINARDAMPEGGRLIIESSNAILDENGLDPARTGEGKLGQYVLLAVSDTGCGMDRATLEQAFEPFFTTKGVGKGNGLGLSMVYGFVKQSRGHIRIYSEPGEGTTVKLYLPRPPLGETLPVEDESEDQIRGGTEKILLVEDDELVRNHVVSQLVSLGYDVVQASNGPEALEILNHITDFDLLFTDVIMPGGMNGRQLAEAAVAMCPGLPVLFTSGYTENAIIHHGRLDPGVHLLQKPYRRFDLAAKVRGVLDQAANRITPPDS